MATAFSRANLTETSEGIEFRPSTSAFLFKSGAGWMIIAVTILTIGYAGIVTIPFIGIKWLSNKMTHFSLEGNRLFMRRGILIRSEEEIELYRIKDVKANFSIIQQIFGNGDISIISSDATGSRTGTRATFNISNVANARELREEVRSRVEVARKRLGVREFDVA